MTQPLRIVLTTGDINGIGFEVTAKALAQIKPKRNVQFYIWRSPKSSPKYLRLIDKNFKRMTVTDWPTALNCSTDYYRTIIDINSPLSPAVWVEQMAFAGISKKLDALVTAPLSKTEIISSGMKDRGHTDILKRVSGQNQIFMCFLGKVFNTVLLTGHCSIKKAYEQINSDLIVSCGQLVKDLEAFLPKNQKSKPIALVGCNPHAGEEGVIDDKELNEYKPAIKVLRQQKINVTDPLVPDVCFQKRYWNQYSSYISSYHDQGLIPFKMVHGANSGIQLSLGLPFLRTSVCHGTAKDIFEKNKANSKSMEMAIKIAIKMLTQKPIVW
jgi:4-hydroxy-L-threonine phosphate dehydrogenase PdxA